VLNADRIADARPPIVALSSVPAVMPRRIIAPKRSPADHRSEQKTKWRLEPWVARQPSSYT